MKHRRGPPPPRLGFRFSLGLLLLLAGCGSFGRVPGPDDVAIPPIAMPRARMPTGPIPATFRTPPGKVPFPAVIVLHGCGGLGPSQDIWAGRLMRWGYAVLIPDSMTPRGETRVCEPEAQHLVTPADRVGDIGAAVAWLRGRKEIDPDRIAVLGLSHGGATAALATQSVYQGLRLRAAVDYYGACVDPAAHGTVPLLVLAGELDDWGHPAERCAAYANAVDGGQVIELHVYPGVFHAFDNPAMPHMVSDSHIMEYNQAAAEDSFQQTHAFLERWMARRTAGTAPSQGDPGLVRRSIARSRSETARQPVWPMIKAR